MTNEESELWWKQANIDLESAKYNLSGEKLDVAAFLAHQSVEKALKALRIKKLNNLIKIHDLVKLARDLNAPNKIIDYCSKLNPVYIDTRYPDYTQTIPAELYSYDAVEEFINMAEEIIEWVQKKIK